MTTQVEIAVMRSQIREHKQSSGDQRGKNRISPRAVERGPPNRHLDSRLWVTTGTIWEAHGILLSLVSIRLGKRKQTETDKYWVLSLTCEA